MSNRLRTAVQTLFERQNFSSPSVWALIIANIYPVIGVIFLHWQTFPLLLFFWTENLVIGFYTVLKMLTASSDNAKPAAKVFMIPFFCMHYGIFTLVHGIFVVAIFGTGFADSVSMDFDEVWQQVVGNGLIWGTLVLMVSHGLSFFQNYIGKNEYRQVALTMPRFTFKSEFKLSDALEEMGMPLAFSDGTDFSGMTGKPDLRIDQVYHQAFVAVDETGTEAAAATAVLIAPTSVQPESPVQVTIDRPFFFLIRDTQTGAILFVGRVLDPS